MADLVKRLHYFNRQFLRAPDFTAEQDYHVQHERDHMRLLHTAGIAAGLEVPDPPAGATAVTVNAGVAYDGQGRRIVLADNQSFELADVAAGEAVFVTIAYDETETDPTDETGVSGNTRWTEQPLIEKLAAAPANPNKLVLARILRDGTTISIDRSQRRVAGVKVGDMQAPSLTLTSDAISPSGWLTMNLGAPGRADVMGDLQVTGNLVVQGETTVVSTKRMRGNVVLGDADNDTATVEGSLVTGHSSGRLKIGSPTDIAGNVVLGGADNDTATVEGSLVTGHSSGRLKIGSPTDIAGNLTLTGAVALPADPAQPLHAATKQYVDTRVAKAGDTMTGRLNLPANGLVVGGNQLAVAGGNVEIGGNVSMLAGSNPLNFTSGWTESPDRVTNVAEICNDVGRFKTLMIVGNRSDARPDRPGFQRRVSVWDRLEVNGDLIVRGSAFKSVGGPFEQLGFEIGPLIPPRPATQLVADKELKKDIAPIEGALEKILRLRGISFVWREPEKHRATSDRYMGMVAQDVEEVFPEWVKTVPSGHKGLDLVGFEALVVEALRELATRCEKLEAELAQARAAVGKRKGATPAPKKR
jgi:hypothetical protein